MKGKRGEKETQKERTKRNRDSMKPENEGHSKDFPECAYYFWPFINFSCQPSITPYHMSGTTASPECPTHGAPSARSPSLEQTSSEISSTNTTVA